MLEMVQEIVYRVRIDFLEAKEISFLRAVEIFLRLLGEVDSFLVYTLGMELRQQSSLKEMSESGFHYDMKLSLIWPQQDFLGGLPDSDNLEQWLNQCRKYILDSLKGNILSLEQIAWQLGDWAKTAGLTDSLVYHPIEVNQIRPLVTDLNMAISELGESTSVLLDFTRRKP